jgi:hypothetical protein
VTWPWRHNVKAGGWRPGLGAGLISGKFRGHAFAWGRNMFGSCATQRPVLGDRLRAWAIVATCHNPCASRTAIMTTNGSRAELNGR